MEYLDSEWPKRVATQEKKEEVIYLVNEKQPLNLIGFHLHFYWEEEILKLLRENKSKLTFMLRNDKYVPNEIVSKSE